jgi:hypothetical protein
VDEVPRHRVQQRARLHGQPRWRGDCRESAVRSQGRRRGGENTKGGMPDHENQRGKRPDRKRWVGRFSGASGGAHVGLATSSSCLLRSALPLIWTLDDLDSLLRTRRTTRYICGYPKYIIHFLFMQLFVVFVNGIVCSPMALLFHSELDNRIDLGSSHHGC